jgi:uncharacterized protein YPO0396
MRKRDSKTGRFVKSEVKEAKVELEKVQSIVSLSKRTLKVKTGSHLKVFSTKRIEEGSQSKMRPGADVIMDFLDSTAPNGEQLVRVRKDGSTRTFYTTSKFAQEVLP